MFSPDATWTPTSPVSSSTLLKSEWSSVLFFGDFFPTAFDNTTA